MLRELNFENIDVPSRHFITGIGTDVGKTYVTGYMAKKMDEAGINVITQKFVQTGNVGSSEDIEKHRQLMGIPLVADDKMGVTAPVIFSYPCSPDLAARIDNRPLDLSIIDESSEVLESRYGHVLIEGAGGVMVPLDGEYLTIDYIADRNLAVVVTYNGQLGSINHTLLTVKALLSRGVKIFALVYNSYFDKDKTICSDTVAYMDRWIERNTPDTLHFKI